MLNIREAIDSDRDAIWKIFQEVIAAGETYPIDPKISREEVHERRAEFEYECDWGQPTLVCRSNAT